MITSSLEYLIPTRIASQESLRKLGSSRACHGGVIRTPEMALASGRGHLARQWHVPRLPSAVLPVATATATASPAASVQWLSRVINTGELRGSRPRHALVVCLSPDGNEKKLSLSARPRVLRSPHRLALCNLTAKGLLLQPGRSGRVRSPPSRSSEARPVESGNLQSRARRLEKRLPRKTASYASMQARDKATPA